MQLINLNSYNGKDIANHMSSSSGDYFDADGNAITYADLIQKKALQQKVLNGELATTTDPRYAKRDAQKNGDDKGPAHLKSSDYQNNFDHFVIEQIPPNLSEEQYKKYEQIITNEFRNLKVFYATKDTGFLHLGERQVLSRMDTDTTGHKHLHIVVNRMAIVDKSTVEEALKEFKENNDVNNLTDNQKLYVASLEKAISFMTLSGKDKALEQSADFQQSYLQRALTENINKNLLANGLAPIASSGSYSQNGNSNKKTTEESKKTVAEIEANNFSEESTVKAIEKINETQFSSLDAVILQRKLEENKKKAQAVSDELLRINAENRVLLEAQIAFNNATVLTQQNEVLNKKVEELEAKVNEAVEVKDRLEIEVSNKDEFITKQSQDIQGLQISVEELKEEVSNEKLNVVNLQDDLDIAEKARKELEEKNKSLVADNAQLDAMFNETKNDLDDEKVKSAKLEQESKAYADMVKTQQSMLETMQKQIQQNQAIIDAQNKATQELQEKLASAYNDNNALKIAADEALTRVVELDKDNEALNAKNQSMEASNKVLTAKVDTLTKENSTLIEVAVRLSEFTKKVTTTLDKFTTAVKGLVKSAPTLKSQVAEITKDHAAVTKEGKQLTDAQKKIQEIMKAKEEAAKANQAGANTAPGAGEVKPK